MTPVRTAAAARVRRRIAVASTLVALGIAAPSASAAPGQYRGSGTDAAGDAPSNLDLLKVGVGYGQATGLFRVTIRVGSKPPGDVDVLLGKRQASGACGLPFVTLSTNVAAGTAEWRGSGGRAKAKAKVSYAAGVITASVTDVALKGRTPSCAMAMSYGAGAAHSLRDTLDVFEVTDQPTPPPTGGGGSGGDDGSGGEGGSEGDGGSGGGDSSCADGLGLDTDNDEIPDDFNCDGQSDVPTDPGSGAEGAPQLVLKVNGLPRRLRRGRSYEARIRIRNDGDVDATKLRVRLAKKAGVAVSRRVALVSRVRSGKAVTVHVRVRLTSSRAVRTVRVSVSGSGVEERTSFRLRRRGAR